LNGKDLPSSWNGDCSPIGTAIAFHRQPRRRPKEKGGKAGGGRGGIRERVNVGEWRGIWELGTFMNNPTVRERDRVVVPGTEWNSRERESSSPARGGHIGRYVACVDTRERACGAKNARLVIGRFTAPGFPFSRS